MKKYILLIVSVLTVCNVIAQNPNLTVSSLNGVSVETILQQHFQGEGVIISGFPGYDFIDPNTGLVRHAKFNGQTGNVSYPQIGTFNRNGFTDFPFEKGLVMTTGNVSVAAGPNNTYSASSSISPYYPAPSWLGDYTTNNVTAAAVLEFDFIAMADTFSFNYIFASEEYCNFVNNDSWNDVFAFRLEGHDPLLPGSPITIRNVAIVPNSITASNPNGIPVSIGTINHGYHSHGSSGPGTQPSNSQYFICNYGNTYGIQYNGYTTALSASAAIMACNSYHMTLGITNVGDYSYDSGVFLEEGSFYSPHVKIGAYRDSSQVSDTSNETSQVVDTLIQNCRDLDLLFSIKQAPITGYTAIKFEFDPDNTAVVGNDYILMKPDGTQINTVNNTFHYPTNGDTMYMVHVLMQPDASPFPNDVLKTANIYVRTQGCDGLPVLEDNLFFQDTIVLYFRSNDSIRILDTSVTVCDMLKHIEVKKVRGSDSLTYQWYSSTWTPNPPGIDHPDSLVTGCNITTTSTFYVVASDKYGCLVDTATVQVNVVPKPDFTVTYTPKRDCVPIQVTINTQYTPSSAKLHWDVSGGAGYTYIDSVATIRPTLTEPGNYSISLFVESAPGCDSSFTYSNVIHVSDYPHADFTYTPAEPENGQEIQFSNLSTGDDITEFAWSFGDGHTSYIDDPTHTYHLKESDLMTVHLTVTNADGCSDDTLQIVPVEDNFAFFTANAFSPNWDGNNDVFLPVVNDVVNYELTIYSRSGEMIFYSNSTDIGWDGNIKGDPAPEGVYIWKVQYSKIGTPEVMNVKTGSVMLVR